MNCPVCHNFCPETISYETLIGCAQDVTKTKVLDYSCYCKPYPNSRQRTFSYQSRGGIVNYTLFISPLYMMINKTGWTLLAIDMNDVGNDNFLAMGIDDIDPQQAYQILKRYQNMLVFV